MPLVQHARHFTEKSDAKAAKQNGGIMERELNDSINSKSIDSTLKTLLKTFEVNYLRHVSQFKLQKDLTRGLLSHSAYDRNKEANVAEHIKNHIDDYHALAREISRER